MEWVVASIIIAALLAAIIWLARKQGQTEEKRVAAEYSAKVKDKQLDIAARTRPSRSDLLQRMREGKL